MKSKLDKLKHLIVDGALNEINTDLLQETLPEEVKNLLLEMCSQHASNLFYKRYGNTLMNGASDSEALEDGLIYIAYLFLVNGYVLKNEMDRMDIKSLFED